MPADAKVEAAVIPCEGERVRHRLVRERPRPPGEVRVTLAALNHDPDRLARRTADPEGELVAAPNVGVAAHMAEDDAKEVGALPCCVESADSPAAHTAYRPPRRVRRELDANPCLHHRQQVRLQKSHEGAVARVVLDRALVGKFVVIACHESQQRRQFIGRCASEAGGCSGADRILQWGELLGRHQRGLPGYARQVLVGTWR
mmetsp:Transcript_88177/g.278911  ORF Transcript_88177/g.278911 Transcript_88177/m.278911 type:complete len:202 (-) Transcript_88177:493-1098(-)